MALFTTNGPSLRWLVGGSGKSGREAFVPSARRFSSFLRGLTQIESQMNSRPLVPLSEDPNDLSALTPAHFLIGTTMNALPDPDLHHIPTNRLDHYQQLQMHTQKFWDHWKREYIQELQKDTKRCNLNNEIQPGRMVVIVDEFQAPIRWPLARIAEIHPGKDNITRVVSLRTSKGIITRPITKIALLPLIDATNSNEDSSMVNNQQTVQPPAHYHHRE
ncbi:uncharacterized protein LOC129773747 [Toxorhynchites rutilus septentrionalis]|uniref:uncharacterized protein LOC129773747 n=1 Tax=Toxorhynchites rutilus septentrionalis TaxID=329112 RepID=UPI002478C028|nr:uncharacterized protein LOC129773747 [Toxorhynchites rutilus septentrionalis]